MFYKLALLLFLLPHLTYGLACEKSFAKRSKYVSYQEARKYAKDNKITGVEDWFRRKHPAHIPSSIAEYFKKRGEWRGWPAFLGKKYVSYEAARRYAIKNNIKSEDDWFRRTHPENIPRTVAYYFKKQGKWTSWYDFLNKKKDKKQATYNISYEEARQYAIENNIKSIADWKRRSHPAHIPRSIVKYFQRRGKWTSWYDFLNKKKSEHNISYEEIRQYAIKNNIRSAADWESREHPPQIPRNVAKHFQKQDKWTSWYDFLNKKKNEYNISYEEARQYAIKNNIRSEADWKSREHPPHIPKSVVHYFQRQDKWQGWHAFLGKKRDRRQDTYNISYEEARQYAIEKNIRSQDDWLSREHPANIPRYIAKYFKKRGKWTSWYDFLGKQKKQDLLEGRKEEVNKYVSYEEAREYAIKNQIKNAQDWNSREHPPGIPSNVAAYFKRQDKWTNWYDFLGKQKKQDLPVDKKIEISEYVPYEEAREYAIKNQIKNAKDWKSREHPVDIPKNPDRAYERTDDWQGWPAFLGTALEISYAEARQYAIDNKITTANEWKKHNHPPNIPKNPQQYFSKTHDWISWYDFLGKEKKNDTSSEFREHLHQKLDGNKVDKSSDIFIIGPLGSPPKRRIR